MVKGAFYFLCHLGFCFGRRILPIEQGRHSNPLQIARVSWPGLSVSRTGHWSADTVTSPHALKGFHEYDT